jgi:hypothetical protein
VVRRGLKLWFWEIYGRGSGKCTVVVRGTYDCSSGSVVYGGRVVVREG